MTATFDPNLAQGDPRSVNLLQCAENTRGSELDHNTLPRVRCSAALGERAVLLDAHSLKLRLGGRFYEAIVTKDLCLSHRETRPAAEGILPDKGGNDQGTETGLLTYKFSLQFNELLVS